ncbi:hypothetical protein LCGC14_1865620 [marine sediment metagenome]|uniref:Glycosyltransferase 2-like domain-containing protein n=1 Tax=marine sediment metagenome TaxID=412755 RepID=A0A0F9IKQ0_9ZZZZ
MRLAIVTAHLDKEKTREYWQEWEKDAPLTRVEGIMGPVPAFYEGCIRASREWLGGSDLIACLHDDLAIHAPTFPEEGWVAQVARAFDADSELLLAGFGGATGLGEEWIYERAFDPMSLVRKDFISNMDKAEVHGRRVEQVTEVACLDGFSLIGRAEFMLAGFHLFKGLGIIHHAYDSALGALAYRWGGKVKMIPVRCHHAGGRTAVGQSEYAEWAEKMHGGNKTIWLHAHHAIWHEFRDVLPIRVGG